MLTDAKIKALAPREALYRVADRDGLYVAVLPSGVKSFRYNSKIAGRQETVNFGQFPVVTLLMAREKLIEAKRLLLEGRSPAMEKKAKALQKKTEMTVEDALAEWIESAPMADSTRRARTYTIRKVVLPKLGKLRLSELNDADIRRAIEPIRKTAPATALSTRDIISALYSWLNDTKGLRIDNPARYVKPSTIHVFRSRDRNLSAGEIRDFYRALDFTPIASQNKAFLKLLLLTAVRKGELVGAKWCEVDFEGGKWTIPADRMKTRLAHIVYLSSQALDLFLGLQLLGDGASEYVFPGRNDTSIPIVPQSPNKWINDARRAAEKQGIEIPPFTPHDFRRTFSTFANEEGFRPDIVERCLAHERHDIRAVYNRAEYAPDRKQLMQWWADKIDAITAEPEA